MINDISNNNNCATNGMALQFDVRILSALYFFILNINSLRIECGEYKVLKSDDFLEWVGLDSIHFKQNLSKHLAKQHIKPGQTQTQTFSRKLRTKKAERHLYLDVVWNHNHHRLLFVSLMKTKSMSSSMSRFYASVRLYYC